MRGLVAAMMLVVSGGAAAQTPPPPAGIAVPDLSRAAQPDVVAEGWKYFLFRKPGISYAAAFRDFSDCYRFVAMARGQNTSTTRFVPWDEAGGREAMLEQNQYGVVGAVIGQLVAGTLARRTYQANMRVCMEQRGYVRYGVPEAAWEDVSKRPQPQWAAVQARVASGADFGGKVPVK